MSLVNKIHKQFISNPIFLIVSILIFLSFRFIGMGESNIWELLGSFGIQLGIASCLIYINQTFVIVRCRTYLPAFFYLLFSGTNENLFVNFLGACFAFMTSICLFILFSTYQKSDTQPACLLFSSLIAVSSLFWPPILFLFPVFWYGLFALQSLNLKTFLASLSGILLIFSGMVCWSLIIDDGFSFLFIKNLFPSYQALWSINLLEMKDLHEWIYAGVLVLLIVFLGINLFNSKISERVRSVITLNFLYLFLVIILLFVTFQSSDWISILYVPLSFLLGHYFTVANKKGSSWLVGFIIIFFVASFFREQILSFISLIESGFSALSTYFTTFDFF